MPRYSRDPYWLTAKFNSQCRSCDAAIRAGERIWYYPNSKSAHCFVCGDDMSRAFEALRQDEEVYNS